MVSYNFLDLQSQIFLKYDNLKFQFKYNCIYLDNEFKIKFAGNTEFNHLPIGEFLQ